MPGILMDKGEDRARERSFPTFSDYIQDLVRRDTAPST